VITDSSGQDVSPYVGDILLKLDCEFPGDAGGFSIYFLNILRLKQGEAIYLAANLPHAYLSGGKDHLLYFSYIKQM